MGKVIFLRNVKPLGDVGRAKPRERRLAAASLVLILIATLVAGRGLLRLESNYSINQFFPEHHPLIEADDQARKQFFLDQTSPLIAVLNLPAEASGDWLENGRLERLAILTKALKEDEGVKSALSLGVVTTASQGVDSVSVGTLLEQKDLAKRRAQVLHDRLLSPSLLSADGRRTVVVLSLRDDVSAAAIAALTESAKSKLAAEFPEARVEVGGVPAIQTHLSELVKSEVLRFMGLALLACCAVLALVFSSLAALAVPLLAVLLANIWVLAFMAVSGISMTVLAVTIPILVSVTVLSLCIHTSLRLTEEASHATFRSGAGLSLKASVVMATLRALFLPNLLTSATTCFGFATLVLTDVPVIHDFGVAVAVAVMISWGVSLMVMAPLFVLLPIPRMRRWVLREARWADGIFRYRRSLIASIGGICLVMLFIGRDLHWSARLFDDLPAREEARHATELIDQSLGGTIPFEIVVAREKVSEPWNDPGDLANLDRLLHEMRGEPEVGSAVGLPDLMRTALGGVEAPLPESRTVIAENYFMISMAEDSPLKKFLTPNGAATRIGLRLRDVASDRMNQVMEKLLKITSAAFPGAKVSSAGLATTVHRLNNGVSLSLMEGFWQALAVISCLLLLVFRSWRWTLVAVLPNLVPAAVLVGCLALLKTPIKPVVALVFSIALGIAFNNTVYLLQRLRSLMTESKRGAAEEIERTLRLEGNPCLVASICLLAGFGIFLLSEFGINKTFGVYMLISLFFGLVGDLVLMPALVRTCPWILASTARAGGANLENEAPASVQSAASASEEKMSAAKSRFTKAAAFVGAALTVFLPFEAARAAAAADANTILKKVEAGLNAKDESALIKMKVVESNGSEKEREVEIKRKSGGNSGAKNQVLVRLKSPSDVSGVALLSVSQGGNEDQWLYMPSQKKARRVVSGNKSQRFLDTEFNLEDFSASTYSRFENKLVKEDRQPSAAVAVIESKSRAGAESSYSKIMTWVDLASYHVQKSEYYDKDGKLLKTMIFRDYKKFGSSWRAQTVEVRNMQTSRSTILKLADVKLNSGLSDREFTQSALED